MGGVNKHLSTRTPNCSPGTAASMTAPCVCVCVCVRACVHACVRACVCAHFGWVKCRAQIPSMGHQTWPDVMSFTSGKC